MNKIAHKIKILLGMVKEEFATAKLEDGTELSFEALEVGNEVYDVDGNVVADGTYTFEDGTVITVAEGTISEVTKPEDSKEDVTEETVEAKAEEETPVEETPTTEDTVTEDLTPRIESLETAVDELYEMVLEISNKLKNNEEKVEETVEEFKKIKREPTAQPIHFNSNKQNVEEKMTASECFLAFKNRNK